jgi:hypothetical protein
LGVVSGAEVRDKRGVLAYSAPLVAAPYAPYVAASPYYASAYAPYASAYTSAALTAYPYATYPYAYVR